MTPARDPPRQPEWFPWMKKLRTRTLNYLCSEKAFKFLVVVGQSTSTASVVRMHSSVTVRNGRYGFM